MIDIETIRNTIASSLKEYLGIPVIRSNQNKEPPAYPYATYTITTPIKANNGTYGDFVSTDVQDRTYGDLAVMAYSQLQEFMYRQLNSSVVTTVTKAKEIQQIWSLTVQSDNDIESVILANKAFDFLSSSTALNESGIVVQLLGNITNRDNLLTIGYEYRNGFDITFAFMNEILQSNTDTISDFNISYTIN